MQSLGKRASARAKGFECGNCRGAATVVYDNHSGDQICTGCGQVLQERTVCEEQEWRNFSSKDGIKAADRSRVGAANDDWLDDVVGGTAIATANAKFKDLVITQSAISSASQNDRQLKAAFAKLNAIADHINLNCRLVERCKELLKDIQLSEKVSVRGGVAAIMGLIYFAAREERKTVRTDLLQSYDRSVNEREILRYAQKFKKTVAQIAPQAQSKGLLSSQTVLNAVAQLQLSGELKELCCAIATNIDTRQLAPEAKPQHVAAVAIFLGCQLCCVNVTKMNLLLATQCGISTFLQAYKTVLPHAKEVLPSNFMPKNLGGVNSLISASLVDVVDSSVCDASLLMQKS